MGAKLYFFLQTKTNPSSPLSPPLHHNALTLRFLSAAIYFFRKKSRTGTPLKLKFSLSLFSR